MADPLSIIASIAGLLDIAARTSAGVIQLIADWKDAPKQVHFLSEEISMSQQVAQQLKDLCDTLDEHSFNNMRGSAIAIMTQLNRARPVWTELEELVQSVRISTKSKINNARWLRKAGSVVALQVKLREIRFSTLEILAIHNASQTTLIHSAIATYHSKTIEMSQLTTATMVKISESIKEMELRSRGVRPRLRADEMSFQDREITAFRGHSDRDAIFQSRVTCRSRCFCRCHTHKRRGRIRIAPFHSVLGSFVVVYSGWAFAGQHCDMASCVHAEVSGVDAKYSLPGWFPNLTILATFRISHGLPTAGLTVQRIIPHDTYSQFQSIIGFSKLGNCAAIQSLLERRPDAVLDVAEHTRATALDSALRYHQVDACRLLLAAGADPLAEDDLGMPVITSVLLYRHHRKVEIQEEFENLLPLTRFYEEYEFSHLHKIVLGVRPLDLKSELDAGACYSQLNQPDTLGYTPLHWAASQGDSSAVRLLLEAGAEVDKVNSNGETPLHLACQAGSRNCVAVLIDAGADLHRRRPNGYQAIHVAAMAMDGVQVLNCLLSHGALIDDAENYYKTTPVALTTLYDRVDNCKFLLEKNAQIDRPDWEWDTPMFEGIKSVHGAKCLSLFLRNNANYLHTNYQGQNLLHKVAFLGNAEQVNVLASANLKGLDPHAKDVHNMTAQQYLDARVGIAEDHKNAFGKLVKKIEKANAVTAEYIGNDCGEGNDIFVDALEY